MEPSCECRGLKNIGPIAWMILYLMRKSFLPVSSVYAVTPERSASTYHLFFYFSQPLYKPKAVASFALLWTTGNRQNEHNTRLCASALLAGAFQVDGVGTECVGWSWHRHRAWTDTQFCLDPDDLLRHLQAHHTGWSRCHDQRCTECPTSHHWEIYGKRAILYNLQLP